MCSPLSLEINDPDPTLSEHVTVLTHKLICTTTGAQWNPLTSELVCVIQEVMGRHSWEVLTNHQTLAFMSGKAGVQTGVV